MEQEPEEFATAVPWEPFVVATTDTVKGRTFLLDPLAVSQNKRGAINAIAEMLAFGARVTIGRVKHEEDA